MISQNWSMLAVKNFWSCCKLVITKYQLIYLPLLMNNVWCTRIEEGMIDGGGWVDDGGWAKWMFCNTVAMLVKEKDCLCWVWILSTIKLHHIISLSHIRSPSPYKVSCLCPPLQLHMYPHLPCPSLDKTCTYYSILFFPLEDFIIPSHLLLPFKVLGAAKSIKRRPLAELAR